MMPKSYQYMDCGHEWGADLFGAHHLLAVQLRLARRIRPLALGRLGLLYFPVRSGSAS
jgi:hypothetical protein